MEDFEILVFWREGAMDEVNNQRLLEIDTAQGPYQTYTPDDFTAKAKTVLDVWNALGAPAPTVKAVNVTAAKAPVTK